MRIEIGIHIARANMTAGRIAGIRPATEPTHTQPAADIANRRTVENTEAFTQAHRTKVAINLNFGHPAFQQAAILCPGALQMGILLDMRRHRQAIAGGRLDMKGDIGGIKTRLDTRRLLTTGACRTVVIGQHHKHRNRAADTRLITLRRA